MSERHYPSPLCEICVNRDDCLPIKWKTCNEGNGNKPDFILSQKYLNEILNELCVIRDLKDKIKKIEESLRKHRNEEIKSWKTIIEIREVLKVEK